MKKLLSILFATLSAASAIALPIGNPATPCLIRDGLIWEGVWADFRDPYLSWSDAISMRAGFYGDYVFNRHLNVRNAPSTGGQIERFQLFTNAGYLAFNLYDRVDIFSSVGTTNINLDGNLQTFLPGAPGTRISVESDADFSWSVGARAILFECGRATFGLEAQYFQTVPRINKVTLSSPTVSFYPDDLLNLRYQEYQVGAAASYRIWNFAPYLGIKWTQVLGRSDEAIPPALLPGSPKYRLRNRFHTGYALGVSIVDSEKAMLTVEGRWPDEKAIYVNGQFRF